MKDDLTRLAQSQNAPGSAAGTAAVSGGDGQALCGRAAPSDAWPRGPPASRAAAGGLGDGPEQSRAAHLSELALQPGSELGLALLPSEWTWPWYLSELLLAMLLGRVGPGPATMVHGPLPGPGPETLERSSLDGA